MKIRKLLCLLGLHDYRTVDMTHSYNTLYTGKPKDYRIHHMVWFQQCSCCGKRRLKDTVKRDSIYSTRHNGVEYARTSWVEYGKIPSFTSSIPTAPSPQKPTLKVIK